MECVPIEKVTSRSIIATWSEGEPPVHTGPGQVEEKVGEREWKPARADAAKGDVSASCKGPARTQVHPKVDLISFVSWTDSANMIHNLA